MAVADMTVGQIVGCTLLDKHEWEHCIRHCGHAPGHAFVMTWDRCRWCGKERNIDAHEVYEAGPIGTRPA